MIDAFFYLGFAFFLQWILRKTYAKVQGRYGPLYTGPSGILQPLADFIKLLTKESVVPEHTRLNSFKILPFIIPIITLVAFLFLPIETFITGFSFAFEGDLILVISLLTLNSILLWLISYATTSIYGNIGGMRLLLQFSAYELVYLISFASPALLVGSLSIASISNSVNIFVLPVAFLFAMLCVLIKLELLPFDIPDAHQEIVSGWATELSGLRYAFIQLNRALELEIHAFLISFLFLGANSWSIAIIYSVIIVFVIAFFSSLFARYRIDQLVKGMWKYILPLSIAQLIPLYLGGLLI